MALFHALFGKDIELPARNHIVDVPFDTTSVSVARTGYTGEDGIEVFFPANDAVKFWSAVLEQGKPLGIKPCGLGARDTLRLEMCYPLNGSDLSPGTKPDRGGTRILRRSSQTRLRRSRCVAEDKRIRPTRKAGAVPDEGERSAAAAALRRVSGTASASGK